jgi:hypothetical protein
MSDKSIKMFSYAETIPTLYDVVSKTAKQIPNPIKSEVEEGRKTVYDTWIHKQPGQVEDRPDLPNLKAPGKKMFSGI